MSDLIKRLRDHGENAVSYPFHKSRELSRNAADEIERLQSAMQYAGAELGKARERIAELEADLEVKTHQHKRDLAEYNRVATKVERLEGAVQHNLDCVHAREARIEKLEAEARWRANGAFLDKPDPAVTEQGE